MIPPMRAWLRFLLILAVALASAAAGLAASAPADDGPSENDIRATVGKALPLIEAGAKGSMEKRARCFTCHNQGLTVMALTTARARGLPIDQDNLARQIDFTAEFLGKNRTNYAEGKGQGGEALTAGYALWTLELGGRKPDAITDAVAEYFLRWQSDIDHWTTPSDRPPSGGSSFTASYLGLRGLKAFGTSEQGDRISERMVRVRDWILNAPAATTEDRVFRLWALQVAEAPADQLARARQDLLAIQRDDGGWGQLPELPADSYATGTALVALHLAGKLPTTDPVYRRGLAWLIAAQLADGSWHVRTRSKPIQTYYESGYPHGEDQFISITAAGWSTTALALALPPR